MQMRTFPQKSRKKKEVLGPNSVKAVVEVSGGALTASARRVPGIVKITPKLRQFWLNEIASTTA